MKTYILLTKLAGSDAQLVEIGSRHMNRSREGMKWLKDIEKQCPGVKFKQHFALMGHWDSMHIYEACDEEVAARVSLLTRARGAAQVESWVALPYEKILQIQDELQPEISDVVNEL
ncbi:MAG: GYD domain-containing protein [Candidatus Zixiibacteriota bacterium]